MRNMIEDYQQQLDLREDEIRHMQARLKDENKMHANEGMLRKEMDAYKQENRVLREKLGQLTHELDILS